MSKEHTELMILNPETNEICYVTQTDGKPDVEYEMQPDGSCKVTIGLIPVDWSKIEPIKLI